MGSSFCICSISAASSCLCFPHSCLPTSPGSILVVSRSIFFLRPPSKSPRTPVLLWVCCRPAVCPPWACQNVFRRHFLSAVALLSVFVFPDSCPFPSFVASDTKHCCCVCPREAFQVFQFPPWFSFVIVLLLVEQLFPASIPFSADLVCARRMAFAFPRVIFSPPFLASASALSFPLFLAWPFTHVITISNPLSAVATHSSSHMYAMCPSFLGFSTQSFAFLESVEILILFVIPFAICSDFMIPHVSASMISLPSLLAASFHSVFPSLMDFLVYAAITYPAFPPLREPSVNMAISPSSISSTSSHSVVFP